MYKFEEQLVELYKLRECPVKVTVHVEKLFSEVAIVAKHNPEQIEPITVAVLGDQFYVVNGHLRLRALQSAGHKEGRSYFIAVKSIAEVVRLHIGLNLHGSVSPFKMLDAVKFLQKHGSVQSVSDRYVELAKKVIYPNVRELLEGFLKDACRIHGSIEMPLYVVERIAEFESEKDQTLAATVILDSIKSLREGKFAFPTPADLDIIFLSIKPRKEQEKEVVIFDPKPEKGERWPKLEREKAEDLVRGSPHNSIVRCRCGNKLLLNTKTRRVSSVKDDAKNRFIKLQEEDEARSVYSLPDSVAEFLHTEPGKPLRFVRIRSKKELVKLASRIRQDAKLRLIVILPR